ncbi:adenine nucleotide alpha hydrolases-like protein [Dichomitus squalens]|uniref:tRNA(Ile)-lysidine synthetase n=1 Tax=Dichomitus squalens TaxID=114155 RepID=A0A4Q9N4R0_9APHY|nr:adenine nucleotide alpha hydrolases-like protein [Dichomitus squalens]
MRLVPPITPAEFFHHLQRCIPPGGWRSRIAVANSGGPDSTALLFLLTATIRKQLGLDENDTPSSESPTSSRFPLHVLSIHVNHGLQAAASAMEETAVRMSERLGAPSIVEAIPWGTPPFPEKPAEGVANRERLIREARYHRLFAAMDAARTNVIAFGHHADDQVETAIMRMSQGSSNRGLAGMRPVRRWGMGHKDIEYSQFGAEGMRSWVVRPFLQIPKGRLLATCEANNLDYVNDPTNFQPGITIRNSVRHALSTDVSAENANVSLRDLPSEQLSTSQSGSSQAEPMDVAPYVARLRAMAPDSPRHEQLRDAVRRLAIRLEEVETQVTNILAQARLPSAPSTLLLTVPGLALATTLEVRTSLIRRCLRYVSYGPWGSTWAEASGDRDTLQRIAEQLWPATSPLPSPESGSESGENAPAPKHERRQFTAGSGVTAIPVTILPWKKDTVRFRPVEKEKEIEGWIFAREAHYQRQGDEPQSRGIVDVTEEIVQAGRSGKTTCSVLYDNRFKLTFALQKVAKPVEEEIVMRRARILIEPDTKWALPMVTLVGKRTTQRCIGKYLWHLDGWQGTCKRPVRFQSWITMNFVRSLDAI